MKATSTEIPTICSACGADSMRCQVKRGLGGRRAAATAGTSRELLRLPARRPDIFEDRAPHWRGDVHHETEIPSRRWRASPDDFDYIAEHGMTDRTLQVVANVYRLALLIRSPPTKMVEEWLA